LNLHFVVHPPADLRRLRNQMHREPVTHFNRNSWRKAEKGRSTMQTSFQSASNSLPVLTGVFAKSRRQGDLAYQVMTIAAIVVLLCSLGIF
jgi:hypothetical protein